MCAEYPRSSNFNISRLHGDSEGHSGEQKDEPSKRKQNYHHNTVSLSLSHIVIFMRANSSLSPRHHSTMEAVEVVPGDLRVLSLWSASVGVSAGEVSCSLKLPESDNYKVLELICVEICILPWIWASSFENRCGKNKKLTREHMGSSRLNGSSECWQGNDLHVQSYYSLLCYTFMRTNSSSDPKTTFWLIYISALTFTILWQICRKYVKLIIRGGNCRTNG